MWKEWLDTNLAYPWSETHCPPLALSNSLRLLDTFSQTQTFQTCKLFHKCTFWRDYFSLLTHTPLFVFFQPVFFFFFWGAQAANDAKENERNGITTPDILLAAPDQTKTGHLVKVLQKIICFLPSPLPQSPLFLLFIIPCFPPTSHTNSPVPLREPCHLLLWCRISKCTSITILFTTHTIKDLSRFVLVLVARWRVQTQ